MKERSGGDQPRSRLRPYVASRYRRVLWYEQYWVTDFRSMPSQFRARARPSPLLGYCIARNTAIRLGTIDLSLVTTSLEEGGRFDPPYLI